MYRREFFYFKQYLEKKKRKKIDFHFKKKPKLPQYVSALTPRVLRKEVLDQIEKSMDIISVEENLPWTGKSLRTAIQKDLAELNALSKLAPRVYALEPQAVSKFRRWISRIKPFYGFSNDFRGRKWKRGFFKPRGSFCLENCVKDIPMFTELTLAGLMTARSEKEWLDIQRRIDTLFLRNEIITSIDRDLHDFRERGIKDPFVDKMNFFGREGNWGEDIPGMCPDDFNPRGGRFPPDGELPPVDPFQDDQEDILDLGLDRDITPKDLPHIDFYEIATQYRIFCYSVLRFIAFEIFFNYKALFYHLPADSPYLISDIITNVSPRHLCSGDTLTIEGEGFGMHPEDSNLRLLLPFEVPGYGKVWRCAEVEDHNWSDISIELECPEWARSGPIGFLDEQVFQDLAIFREWVGDILWTSRGKINGRDEGNQFHSCGIEVRPTFALTEVSVFPTPPLTAVNMFWGTIPEITMVLNGEEETSIQPDGTLVVDWKVISADSGTESIRILKEVDRGMATIFEEIERHYGGNEVTGTITIIYNETTDNDYRIRIEAENSCGSVESISTVHLRESTEVTIYSIEVNQAIQSFNMDEPSKTNIIPLIKGKETVVRVYAGSGKSSNLDHVTGYLYVTQYLGDEVLGPYIVTSYPSEDSLPPDNSVENSRPRLKFILRENYSQGTLELKVRLFSTDDWASWQPVEFTTTVNFEEKSPLKIYMFKVKTNGLETSDEEIDVCIEKLHSIFPVSLEDGINVVGIETLDVSDNNFDFNDNDDFYQTAFWSTDFFDVFDDHLSNGDYEDGVIYCAIIPKEARDREKGIGWPGPPDFLGGTPFPIAYWCAKPERNSYLEAHEIGHAMNLNDQESGSTLIRGADTRFLWGRFEDCDISASTDQMMKSSSNRRWINAPEYMWVMYFINGIESSLERFFLVVAFCAENDLAGSLDAFEIG
ncbi:MAG: hypothetical protein ACFFB5_20765 [Promethearchaeota archaeon]